MFRVPRWRARAIEKPFEPAAGRGETGGNVTFFKMRKGPAAYTGWAHLTETAVKYTTQVCSVIRFSLRSASVRYAKARV